MTLVVAVGSRARGDFDVTSDMDVVLIGGSSAQVLGAPAGKLFQGVNVTRYSTEGFFRRGRSGSLFIAHVINEGVLVAGESREWGRLRTAWSPLRMYDDEVLENLDFLRLLRVVPRSFCGLSAAVDLLVSSVRNIAIRELANRGELVFSWRDIQRRAPKVWVLSRSFFNAVSWAREVKNCRRSGIEVAVGLGELEEFSQAVAPVVRGAKVSFARSHGDVERELLGLPDYSYGQLRALELLCAALPSDHYFAPIRALASSPSYFINSRPKISIG